VQPPRLPPGRTLELPSGRSTFARVDGPRSAPTVLLLHGWAVTADLNWFGVFPHLRDHHVVAPDHLGHGRASRQGRRGQRFTLARAADDALGALDVVGADRAIVVGYSMGGAVAQLLARRHPDRVAGLVLCATACRFSGRAVTVSAGALTAGAALHRRLPPRAALRAFDRVAERRTARWGLTGWPAEEVRRGDPAALIEALAELTRFDSRPWLRSVTARTGLVVTTADNVVALERQHEVVRRRPGAEVVEVEGDHVVCTAAPELFGPALRRALDTIT
jgi:pimeloyl-ACP methyl ester carboxylesterase